uniref:3-hydroxyisobutyryl-CoA hydrolase n=1 Tax=Nicotiana tabacum TaxID=4097 RepID=A0A1S3WZQ4_TOBAC|nr:PREDICTED: 3-hydroxyisobutyryl-CoA hydrolase, mitochondrial-like isoform X4 [Nicotiana tabacum]
MQVTLTSECKELYQKIYSLAYVIGTYSKPQVALLNGITMGGGAAISIPGTFRVATEKTGGKGSCGYFKGMAFWRCYSHWNKEEEQRGAGHLDRRWKRKGGELGCD